MEELLSCGSGEVEFPAVTDEFSMDRILRFLALQFIVLAHAVLQ